MKTDFVQKYLNNHFLKCSDVGLPLLAKTQSLSPVCKSSFCKCHDTLFLLAFVVTFVHLLFSLSLFLSLSLSPGCNSLWAPASTPPGTAVVAPDISTLANCFV